jgi:hypothetical protein
MAKPSIKHTNNNHKIFDELEKLLDFCKEYGYVYNENDLTNQRTNTARQFQKYLNNKPVRNNWENDAKQSI